MQLSPLNMIPIQTYRAAHKSFSTTDYVEETFQWQNYSPEWLKEIEAKGGGIVNHETK